MILLIAQNFISILVYQTIKKLWVNYIQSILIFKDYKLGEEIFALKKIPQEKVLIKWNNKNN
jgi:hypothetical protein